MNNIRETDVAIIGGGIVGTAIAHALSRYKADICLLEKAPAVGFGLTKASQGAIHGGISIYMSKIVKWWAGAGDMKAYLSNLEHLKDRLCDPGREKYLELEPILNAKLLKRGRLMVAETKEELETMKLLKELAEDRGAEEITILDKDGLKEMEPMLDSRFIGGLYDPSEVMAMFIEWATAFTDCAKQNGAHIMLNTEVTGIEEQKGSYLIKTNKGDIRAQYVVNAAGIHSDCIADMIGRRDFSFTIWKCQMLIMENNNYIRHMVSIPSRPQSPKLLLLTPYGNILSGHTMEPSESKYDLTNTKEGIESLYSHLNYYLPEARPSVIRSFTGILHFNNRKPDDYLLECPKPGFVNVIVCPPAGGPAPALAQEVVKKLREQGLVLTEKSDFNPYRHKEPRFVELSSEERRRKINMNPEYGHVVCRCETVTEAEIRQAVRAGATTLDDVKFRTHAGMGRCQGGFCTSRVLNIMAQELGISPEDITQKGGDSYILRYEAKELIGVGV
ncbi:NAD(P)/FAD-dependent oxidoreductase [Chloroflexota bacterium]